MGSYTIYLSLHKSMQNQGFCLVWEEIHVVLFMVLLMKIVLSLLHSSVQIGPVHIFPPADRYMAVLIKKACLILLFLALVFNYKKKPTKNSVLVLFKDV